MRGSRPSRHNRWPLLGWNLSLFGFGVFSSSMRPSCHPVQTVLCWRPFSEADGTWLQFHRLARKRSAGCEIRLNNLSRSCSAHFLCTLRLLIRPRAVENVFREAFMPACSCKVQVREHIKAQQRDETDTTEADTYSNHAARKIKTLSLYFPPRLFLFFSVTFV